MDALKFIEERNRMCDYYRGDNSLSGCAECRREFWTQEVK